MLLKKKFFLLVLLVSTVIGLFLFYSKNKEIQIGGNFSLINHLGENVNNNSFKNNYRLVFFGFTNCPDFCPNTLNNISLIIEQIDNKKKLVPLFITVDPERDNVSRMKEYLKDFHPSIVGLTGTNKQIVSVTKKYKIFTKKVIDKGKEKKHDKHDHDHGGYSIDHTTIIYLMDEKGKYITHFSQDTTNQKIIEKINQYVG